MKDRILIIKCEGCTCISSNIDIYYAKGITNKRKLYGQYCKYENKNNK
jgi:hypothetical protein